MAILVTGVKGQLGYDIMKVLNARGIDCVGADIEEFDITDAKAVEKYITELNPSAVIHCSAYTAVEKAEENADLVFKVNVEGPKNIATVCKQIDAKMVYISTDYVFPGVGENAYEVFDEKNPQSVYGKTKLGGEEVVKEILSKYFIIRISWVFGLNGSNFVRTMLKIGKDRDTVNVVNDQIGSPTYTADLAPILCDMVVTDKYGEYHATNEGYCSWAEFAQEIFDLAGYKTKVNPIPTSEYPTKAVRPFNSRMSKKSLDSAGFKRLPDWHDALKRYMKELENE